MVILFLKIIFYLTLFTDRGVFSNFCNLLTVVAQIVDGDFATTIED